MRYWREWPARSRPGLRSNNKRYVISASGSDAKTPVFPDPIHALPIQKRILARLFDGDFDYPALNHLGSDPEQDRTRAKRSQFLQSLKTPVGEFERWAVNND